MEGESGGVGRKKMYFVAPGVGIDSLGGFLRSESAYIRATSVMGGPLACFFFFNPHGSWGSRKFDARTETPCAA